MRKNHVWLFSLYVRTITNYKDNLKQMMRKMKTLKLSSKSDLKNWAENYAYANEALVKVMNGFMLVGHCRGSSLLLLR